MFFFQHSWPSIHTICCAQLISTHSVLFLHCAKTKRKGDHGEQYYLQTGFGAGPSPDGLQSGKEAWQSNERNAGLHTPLSPSTSAHQL